MIHKTWKSTADGKLGLSENSIPFSDVTMEPCGTMAYHFEASFVVGYIPTRLLINTETCELKPNENGL